MQKPNPPRGFEDRLLGELKIHISERAHTMTATDETPEKTPRFGRATKFSLAGAVGAGALGLGAVVALPALLAGPAYAVETKDGGDIRIEIRSFEDAEGLEATLAEHGVQSRVDFPAEGTVCDPDRLDETEWDWEAALDSSLDGSNLIAFDVNPDEFKPGGDKTLVIELSEGYFDDRAPLAMYGITAAKGEVGDCDPVDDGIEYRDRQGDGEEEMQQELEEGNGDGSKSKSKN